ncbi:hypothetical protein INR49_022097 [Caranx melampygus]|nr:hypothetical protein INR49_022097 [Caranx melampygus]
MVHTYNNLLSHRQTMSSRSTGSRMRTEEEEAERTEGQRTHFIHMSNTKINMFVYSWQHRNLQRTDTQITPTRSPSCSSSLSTNRCSLHGGTAVAPALSLQIRSNVPTNSTETPLIPPPGISPPRLHSLSHAPTHHPAL